MSQSSNKITFDLSICSERNVTKSSILKGCAEILFVLTMFCNKLEPKFRYRLFLTIHLFHDIHIHYGFFLSGVIAQPKPLPLQFFSICERLLRHNIAIFSLSFYCCNSFESSVTISLLFMLNIWTSAYYPENIWRCFPPNRLWIGLQSFRKFQLILYQSEGIVRLHRGRPLVLLLRTSFLHPTFLF